MNDNEDLVEAVNDLARVVIACNDKITSRSDVIRRLHLAAIAPGRIASLLSMPVKDVTSAIHKFNRKKTANGGRRERRSA